MTANRSSPPTLSDVARAAGVGIATASRVINGGTRVSAATMVRVQEAVRGLRFQPNHAARVLRGAKAKIIGLLVPNVDDSFFSNCARAVETVARQHDYLLVVMVSNNNIDSEINSLSALMRHRPDGLLLVPSAASSKRLMKFVQESSIPIIAFDRPVWGCRSVVTNNRYAARSATNHLIEHGYRRILCLGSEPELFTIRERMFGYKEAMKTAGLEPLVNTTLPEDTLTAKGLLSSYLSAPHAPEAIFTLKNSATITTFQVMAHLKVSIPSDIALLGFDDFTLANVLQPSVSVVQQPMEEVGRKAAELLFAQLSGTEGSEQAGRPLRVVLANRLILRSSCGCVGQS